MTGGLGPHAGFILFAYAVTALVMAALIAWVVLDHIGQKRRLSELEARGIRRRSASRAVSEARGDSAEGAS